MSEGANCAHGKVGGEVGAAISRLPSSKVKNAALQTVGSISLASAAETFSRLEDRDLLEALVAYGRELPPLPEHFRLLRDAGVGMIPACSSPVFLLSEVAAGTDRLYADAPRGTPIRRGFVSLLLATYGGVPGEKLAAAPADILGTLHLITASSLRRRRGLSGIFDQLRAGLKRAA